MATDAQLRRRLDRLTTALRHFGIVDRFELSSLFRGAVMPNRAAVVDRLRRNTEALPPAVGADYLGAFLLAEVGREENAPASGAKSDQTIPEPLSTADGTEFDSILTGPSNSRKYAARYQRHVRRLVSQLFEGRLLDAGSEVQQFGGTGRIDLVFRNIATCGFFNEVAHRLPTRGLFLAVECKNYMGDPENPEFAQLLQRLNPGFGTLGIVACREVSDRDAALRRCAPYVHEGKWMLVLSDAEFRQMIAAHLAGDTSGVEAPLYEQLQQLALA